MSPLASLKGRSFLATTDLSAEELHALVEAALAQKEGRLALGRPMEGLTALLLFFNPSLRTRLSMTAAVHQLGGHPMVVDAQQSLWNLETRPGAVMDQDKVEHLADAVPVASLYADLVALRCFPRFQSPAEDLDEPMLGAFARGGKPVVNLESATHHPCQALADMLTIREKLGALRGRRAVLAWTWHPKALPLAVPNSFALAAAQCGLDLTIACPPSHVLPDPLMAGITAAARASGGDVRVSHDLDEACVDAEVVYAKSWSSATHYGDAAAELAAKSELRDWIIDERRVPRDGGAAFMHCLPVRRNVEVADAVIDGPRSWTLTQAENRLHAQRTLLAALTGGFSS